MSDCHGEVCLHGYPVPSSLSHGSQEIGWEEVCAIHAPCPRKERVDEP